MPSEVTLFSGSSEADKRRRAVLDAIDLVPLIDRDGWINFLTWCERTGYEVDARRNVRTAAARQWERLKARLREHGIEVEARSPDEFQNAGREPYRMASMRFTVDGWDRLRALTKALDDWLCAKQEVA